MQELTWNITIGLVVALGLVFVFVVARSNQAAEYSEIEQRAQRLRAYYFWSLIFVMFVATVVTLSNLPYPGSQERRDEPQIVNAMSYQWYWTLSTEEVQADRTVEFRVTSADVNHGFGLYDASLRALAQTQAMPGYVNVLRYTFTQPGIYQILCLEYCGFGHHAMVAKIRVRKP